MILGIDGIWERLKEQYDKVMAFVVLFALVGSLISLGLRVGNLKQHQSEFDSWLKTRRPKHPTAAKITDDEYKKVSEALASPFIISQSTYTNGCGSMFVPQTRFNCVACRMPVKTGAKECPFCHTKVVYKVAENPDPDGDGMPTDWEKKYKLDPYDASDAEKDNDDDGYSNLAEYKEGTDPTDPASHPAAIKRLKLESITGKKFGLRFSSRIKTKSGYKYGLNYRLPSKEIKTAFVALGDTVDGVTVVSYTNKLVEVRKNFPKKDVSELKVRTPDGEEIVLVLRKATRHIKLTAHMVLSLPNGKQKRFDAAKNDEFKIDGKVYKVIDIDGDNKRVVINDQINKREMVIQRAAADHGSGVEKPGGGL